MKECSYLIKASEVCSKKITFTIDDDNKIHNVVFLGGCPGNLKAIGKLVEGMDCNKVCELLEGNTCGYKKTSCADQLTKAIKENLE